MRQHYYKAETARYLVLLVSALLFSTSGLFAHTGDYPTGNIKGKITTSDNKIAAEVTVLIKGTGRGTVSDESGLFEFRKLKAGPYTLQISLTGYETLEQSITVEEDKTAELNLQLQLSDKQLQEVIVTSGRNVFAKKESDYIARMPLKNLENPQVYNVVTKELLQQQMVTDFRGAMKNIPGVSQTAVASNGSSFRIIRGFDQRFGLRNGLFSFYNGDIDPANLERVEVLKGPAGTLFGGTYNQLPYGGIFNRVTKKPTENFKGEVGYSWSSWDMNRLTADINTPLTDDKKALFRINSAFQRENSFIENSFNNAFFIAPSFSYQVNDKLKVLVDADFTNRSYNGANFAIGSGVKAKSWADLNLNYTNAYISPEFGLRKQTVYSIYAQADYKISDTWRSQTNYSVTKTDKTDQLSLTVTVLNDSLLRRTADQVYNYDPQTTAVQQNFIGDVKIGGLRNRVLFAFDATKYIHTNYSYLNSFPNSPILDTVNYARSQLNYYSGQKFVDAVSGLPKYSGSALQYTYGVTVQDAVNVTDNLVALVALRLDHINNKGFKDNTTGISNSIYTQNTVSPRFGLVYQPVPERVSIFANYMNGFKNVTGTDREGNSFVPENANQIEGGVKVDIFQGRLSSTISVYDIEVTDKTRTDPADNRFQVQDATQKSKGVELDITANPFAGLNIVAGYAYNDSKFTKANPNVEGKRPANVANNMVNGWVSYKFQNKVLKAFGVAGGVNYSSESFQNDANTFIIPAYTLFDASLFYEQQKCRLGLKAENLANTKNWNRYGPQSGRRIVANITFRF